MLINRAAAQQQLFLSVDPTLSRSSCTAQVLWLCDTECEGVTTGERGERAHRDTSKEEARPGKKRRNTSLLEQKPSLNTGEQKGWTGPVFP